MKKKTLACLAMMLLSAVAFAKDKKMYINVQETPVKEKKSSFSRTVILLDVATEVIVTKTEGKWSYCYSAVNPSLIGWVSTSSLVKRKPSQYSDYSATADELALAGKAWSEEVENLYKTYSTLNLAAVDQMESIKVDEDQLYQFVVDGNLKGAEE